MVVGIIIGASIFVQPSEINRHVPTVAGVLSVWIVAGILTLFGALVCAELSRRVSAHRRRLRLSEGDALAGLRLPLGLGDVLERALRHHRRIRVVFARYVAFFVPLGDTGIRAVAIARHPRCSPSSTTSACARAACCRPSSPSRKVIAILLLLADRASAGAGPPDLPAAPPAAARAPFREFVLAVTAALFAFGGWHMVTYTAGETRDPGGPFRARC